jgi:polyhydroxyalkanoate synthase
MIARWGAETLPLAGEYFRQKNKELFWKNGLYEATLRVGGNLVDLRNIRASLLHVIAEHDHLVPPECGQAPVVRASSIDREEYVLKGGHVSLVAAPNV